MSSAKKTEAGRLQNVFEAYVQDYFAREKERHDYGGWFDPVYFDLSEFVGRRGKRIRPLLLMGVYQAFGGNKKPEDAAVLGAGLALELLHSFVLIHDDVIDRSDSRRGLPTLHKLAARRITSVEDRDRLGENIAMVAGDMLFAMSIRALQGCDFEAGVKGRALGCFLDYVSDTGAGEIRDILLGVHDIARVACQDIERMYHLKTTRYTFEAPCVIGAMLAGADESRVEALKSFTKPLGLAFQIQNDLLEFSNIKPQEPLTSGDLLEGKKTLLLREAYERLNEIEQSFLQMCLSSASRRESALLKIQDLIRKSGAVEVMEERRRQLFAEAEGVMGSSVFSPVESRALGELMGLIQRQMRIPGPGTV